MAINTDKWAGHLFVLGNISMMVKDGISLNLDGMAGASWMTGSILLAKYGRNSLGQNGAAVCGMAGGSFLALSGVWKGADPQIWAGIMTVLGNTALLTPNERQPWPGHAPGGSFAGWLEDPFRYPVITQTLIAVPQRFILIAAAISLRDAGLLAAALLYALGQAVF
ncbi:MAG: hypothetical protein AB7U41_02240, partial [Dongiaceae bacterium]